MWLLVVPWGASSLTLAIMGVTTNGIETILALHLMLPACLIFGLLGVVFCAQITIPSCLVVSILLRFFPRLLVGTIVKLTFSIILATVGCAFALHAHAVLNMPSSYRIIAVIGGLSGSILAYATWKTHENGIERGSPHG